MENDKIKKITKAERKRLGLYVGRAIKIKGKPMIVREGMNKITRTRNGSLSVEIGYFSKERKKTRKLLNKILLERFTNERKSYCF